MCNTVYCLNDLGHPTIATGYVLESINIDKAHERAYVYFKTIPSDLRGGVLFAYLDEDDPKTISYKGLKDKKKQRGNNEILDKIVVDSSQTMEYFCKHWIQHFEHDHETGDETESDHAEDSPKQIVEKAEPPK